MNAKMSVCVTCVEVIAYLSLCNLHDCTFNIFILPLIFTFSMLRLKKVKGKEKY